MPADPTHGAGLNLGARIAYHSWLLFAFLVTSCFLVWAQFRGLDLLDGACYLLIYDNPADNPSKHTRFAEFARPLWLLCQGNIAIFRIATLALASTSCWVFWQTWRRLISVTQRITLTWWPIWFATLAGIAWVPVALTYNSLTSIFDLLGLAGWLILLGYVRSAHFGWLFRLGLLAFITAIAFFLFLVKPPASLAYIASGILLLCFSPIISKRIRYRIAATIIILATVGSVVVYAHVSKTTFNPAITFPVAGMQISPAWVLSNAVRYSQELFNFWPKLKADLWWVLGPSVLASAIGLLPKASARCRTLVLALLLASVTLVAIIHRLWDGSFSSAVSGEGCRFFLVSWSALLPVWAISLWRTRGRPYRYTIPCVIVFLALPLTSSFGSTNAVYVSALHQTVLWAAGLLIVTDCVSASFASPWFRTASAALFGVGAAAHLFTGHFLKPYMYQSALWQQTSAAKIGNPSTTLKLDPATASFINAVRSTLTARGYKPGDDVFGFFNLPGVIYAIGAKQPGAPWYFGSWYENQDTDGDLLRTVPLDRRRNAWIITQANVDRFQKQFLEAGIEFPEGYLKIGGTINPTTGLEVAIWKPRARP